MSLAPYAMEVARSQGRRHAEPAHPYRDDYHRDRDRIIHSRAFRRLEAKTQVFTRRFSDHFRNRLTHTLEVAQIARTIARALGLNEELCEALALVHDIGHPPFGHAGERKLDALMGAHGDVFDHNLHALRMVESFEQRYAAFPGLNLTFEVREGIVKHSRDYRPDAHPELAEYRLGERPPLEAQLIDLADEIAYNTADLDDGYEAKLLRPEMMRAEVPVFRGLLDQAVSRYPQAAEKLQFNEALKSLIDRLTSDLIEYTRSQLTANHVASLEAVRACPRRLVAFSPAVAEEKRVLQEFLYRRLYQHPQITEERERAVKMLEELFAFFVQQPERLPRAYAAQAKTQPAHRVACDYLAGMTDTYVFRVHRDLLGDLASQPASRLR
ncbi:MAG: deoxyguanosinetriphosphate triphosphohydrolase [Acidobacteria bacterium]|nr:deoxyguanosinetriphosphate triphosphohydrolase [Acidobacteriota bacterium]